MKFKYISATNCRFLLPGWFDIRILRDFDLFLQEVDDTSEHKGVIGKMRQKNRLTQGKKTWDRFLNYDIEICYDMDFCTNVAQLRIQDYYDFSDGSRSGFDRRVNSMFSIIHKDGARWTFKIPLQFLLKDWGDANDGHQCYSHCIKLTRNSGNEDDDTSSTGLIEKCYSGITRRNWLKRLEEHLREVRQGDNKLFHLAWRESIKGKDVVYHSYLQLVNLSYDEAMAWEERYVDTHSLYPKGLNMIPGGFKGLSHLYKHRITDHPIVDLDERDRAIAEFVRQHPRKGMPNPFMTELWKDDEHYLKVISSREKNLMPSQVLKIRELASAGYSITEITRDVGALNEVQVKNVLAERTYKRVY
ncbi:MAG: hypothetical protein HGB01_04385 [Chlorobiaceae bacterium]|nr:hypothetical protein [Chlorobiaceae bacterium]